MQQHMSKRRRASFAASARSSAATKVFRVRAPMGNARSFEALELVFGLDTNHAAKFGWRSTRSAAGESGASQSSVDTRASCRPFKISTSCSRWRRRAVPKL